MDALLLIIRLALSFVFALAAIGKLLDREGSEKAVKEFGVPAEIAKPVGIALPVVEILIALLLLFDSTSWVGAISGLLLLLAFTGGMLWQMAKGRAPDCHCFGQIHSEPVSVRTLLRNITFSLLALFLVALGPDAQGAASTGGVSNTMELILILAATVLGAVGLAYLRQVLENQRQILRRLELLEIVSREGVPQERNDAGHPQDGLPIGSPFPSFELSDTSNQSIAIGDLFANGKPALVFFVSPTCDPCAALLPDMERWEAEIGDRVNFVLISTGSAADNKAKFKGVFADEVVLQEKREVADAVRARWTPTALFVRADRTIGSYLAAGDVAIRELVDKLRAESSIEPHAFFGGHENNGRRPKIGETPAFELDDISGNRITSRDLNGKKTLAVFWSLTCPHCTAMMDDLRDWNRSRTESDPQLIVFSDGSVEDHEDIGLDAPILIDNGYKEAAKLGMFGTPSGVVLDESGRIASETGVGAANIWALIGKRK